jgi:hypothetical protein
VKKFTAAVLCLSLLSGPALAAEQADAPNTETMRILAEKVKADKKLVVAANLELSDGEAKAFWPIYDAYQTELQALNGRLSDTIMKYAKAYNDRSLTDAQATALLNESLAIEADEVAMKKKYADKLSKALPGKKAVRYIQTENKIRAIIRYGMAAEIPLVE